MGVYVYVHGNIKSNTNSKEFTVDINGLNSSKWEHPIMYLFGIGFGTYSFVSDFFDKILDAEDKLYLTASPEGENFFCTKWLDANKILEILEKVDGYNFMELSNQFEDKDDPNDFIQLFTSFSQLKTLAEIEKNRNSKIQITFTVD